MYFIGARSRNDTIMFNLNKKNEYKNYHIYVKEFNPLINSWDDLVNFYGLYLPNFFDSRVFYIC